MSKQTINLGAVANDQTGDALRVGGQKINENFDEVYSMLTEGNLGSFSQIIGQADRLPYFTGVGVLSVTTLNALGRSIIGAASQLAARQALGLGTSSTYDLGAANGVASLGADGKLIPSQTPDMSINDVYPVASQAEMLALPADQGDIAIRTDELNKPYILGALPASTLANWYPIGQSLSAALAALSGLTPAVDQLPYYTGANTAALTTLNALGRSIIGAASQLAARQALGLGTASTLTTVSSSTDTMAGRALTTGYMGLGANDNAPFVGLNQSPANYRAGGVYLGQFVNPQFGTMTGHLITYSGSDANTGSQSFISTAGALFNRAMTGGVWGNWRMVRDTGNTTTDGSGFIKNASPIARISDPTLTTRIDLLDGFTTSGYGAVNDEATGVVIERIELGRYRISGCIGLAIDGWQVNSPSDRNGGKLLGLATGENQPDGSVIVEFRKVKYTLTDDGDLEQVPGSLIEAPLDNWIDVRLEMPPQEPYSPHGNLPEVESHD